MKALAMDLGGTRLKIGLVDDGKIVKDTVIPANSSNGLIPRLPAIVVSVNKLLKDTKTEQGDLSGLGISVPGIVDTHDMRVLSINKKFEDISEIDFNAWSQNNWGIPSILENDARSALIGEWQYGAGKGCDNIVLITLGTGIGGAALIEGKLLYGKHFQAGCLGGHFTVNIHGRKCTCGNTGCVESEASSWVLPELFRTHPDFKQSNMGEETLPDFELLTGLVQKGDKMAVEIMNHCLDAWSAGIVSMIHAYDPELVIIGGGVMKSKNLILPHIRQNVEQNAWAPWGKIRVESAHFTDWAGMLGVTYLLNEKSKTKLYARN